MKTPSDVTADVTGPCHCVGAGPRDRAWVRSHPMADIVVTEFMDAAALDGLAADFDVHYDADLGADPDALAQHVAGARAIIVRNKTRVDAGLIAAAPRLVVIGRLGVGLDNIDLDACARRGVVVCPATGANATSVAEYVLGAVLTLFRPVFTQSDRLLAGRWSREGAVGRELAGRVLGLVGLGGVAQAVAERASALGLRVLAFDPLLPVEHPAWQLAAPVELRQLLAESDVVSLHVPLTSETRNLIDADALDAMKPTAVLINTSRGGIVDEVDLAAALRAGRLAGAALDVFEQEPLGDAADRFEGVPNLILTPHVAGLTAESQARVSAVTADNVRRELEGARP